MSISAKSASRDLEQVVDRIVNAVHPLRIIVFGSAARGELASGSDLDLMVVVPDGSHRRHTAQQLYMQMTGILTPVDLVVVTVSDLERYSDVPGFVYREALRDGKVVYAA